MFVDSEKLIYLKKKIDFDKLNEIQKSFSFDFYRFVSFSLLDNLCSEYGDQVLGDICDKAFDFFAKQNVGKDIKYQIISFQKYDFKILITLCADKPFLVDSFNIWLKNHDIKQKELIHPTIAIERDKDGRPKKIDKIFAKESLICLIIPADFDIPAKDFESLESMHKKLSIVVQDYEEMQQSLSNVNLQNAKCNIQEMQNVFGFVEWLQQDHFMFLGTRFYKANKNKQGKIYFDQTAINNLGLFKDQETQDFSTFTPLILTVELSPEQIIKDHIIHIYKKSLRSDIYKHSRIDTIKILAINKDGEIKGLFQVIGIFNTGFYATSPLKVPFLKQKALKVFEAFEFSSNEYNGRQLKHIIDSVPLDQFYSIDDSSIIELCNEVLNMQNDLVIKLQPDDFGKTLSVLIYISQKRYSETLKQQIAKILCNDFKATLASSNGFVGPTTFSRLIFVLNLTPESPYNFNISDLKSKIQNVSLSWDEKFDLKYNATAKYPIQYSTLYQKIFSTTEARQEAEFISAYFQSNKKVGFDASHDKEQLIIRLYKRDEGLKLSEIIPIFYNFRLKVSSEKNFTATLNDEDVYIHHYVISDITNYNLTNNIIEKLLKGLEKAWNKEIEADPFNGLTLSCGLDYKEIIILRSYGRFLKQIGISYSQRAIAECLSTYPPITVEITNIFKEIFSKKINHNQIKTLQYNFFQSLGIVKRIDHDIILRKIFNAMMATKRTNAFTNGRLCPEPIVSFKIASGELIDAPEPVPFFEIFVYSVTFEGTHLRGGKIARGGIRWSDRPEDFRYEVLGLMKAQMVKNAVIVPVGSKGGFVLKNNEATNFNDLTPDLKKNLVKRTYCSFIEQLLALTDNLENGKIKQPKDIITHDKSDPYLVVAADKGTATFSDLANEIAQKNKFWLNDAFASGGSQGYDHKKLGITAKGAWISVRRHLWQQGINSQKDPITCIGVGDMSGDVFGNGMLMTESLLLFGAFNHNHIFIDPSPDPKLSFTERKRLFESPHLSWKDYDTKLISKGGGVFERTQKTITISKEMAKIFHIQEKSLSPDNLIKSLLKAHVDLIWFGGIGTYIKSTNETHSEVSDRANDKVRINAREVHAKVIGEGANLAVTQKARVEFALRGGAINTDAIDNSGGVDCSDHEVNLKVFLDLATEKQFIKPEERNKILQQVETEVCQLVLNNNLEQTFCLSVAEKEAKGNIDDYIKLIDYLEKSNMANLNRGLEFLPSTEELIDRKAVGKSLTRPEIAVITAYSKIDIYNHLLVAFQNYECFGKDKYLKYFPKKFIDNFKDKLLYHPLMSEITATVLANHIVNRMGPCFVHRLCKVLDHNVVDIVKAFIEVDEAFELDTVWESHVHQFKISPHKVFDEIQLVQKMLDECVIIRLHNKHRLYNCKIQGAFKSNNIPLSIIFNIQILLSACVDLNSYQKIYKKLELERIYEWAHSINPSTHWERSALVELLYRLNNLLSQMCLRNWEKKDLEKLDFVVGQLNVDSQQAVSSSQQITLLDYFLNRSEVSFKN